MNRKGFFISPVFVIKVLFVLLVGFLAISKGMAFAKKDTIFKQTSIDDVSMMVNTLAALPGDAVVTYPRNLSEYSLVLDSTSVISLIFLTAIFQIFAIYQIFWSILIYMLFKDIYYY